MENLICFWSCPRVSLNHSLMWWSWKSMIIKKIKREYIHFAGCAVSHVRPANIALYKNNNK